MKFEQQRPLPFEYKSVKLDCEHRIDIIVEEKRLYSTKALPVPKF
ncbi:GxxExxY protein [Candidatus Kuenenia stuttgartiensis]